ncbi:MAG: hypothetical protein AB7E24_24500 [Novosphingobium sp.]
MMKMGWLGILVIVFALSSCSTFKNMDEGLDGLVGQPIDAAFARLGMPNSESRIADRKVYIWNNAYSMTLPTPQTTNVQGNVGSVPYSATASTTSYQTSEYSCTIRIFIGEDKRILNYDYSGNVGGCETYSSRLKLRN